MDASSHISLDDVDYVLVSNEQENFEAKADRDCFEEGLRKKGLRVERTEDQIFTKLSLPDNVKHKYFEILELRMPLKTELPVQMRMQAYSIEVPEVTTIEILDRMQKIFFIDRFLNILKWLKNYYLHEDQDLMEIEQNQFFAPFKEKQQDLFDLENDYANKKIWNILITSYILSRQRCRSGDEFDDLLEHYTGIEALIHKNIYTAAFPLHDGACSEEGATRNKLYETWGSFNFRKNLRSLDDMRDYLGNTGAVYFAWLEFYTKMLLPASFFGLLLIVYGLITLPRDKFSDDVCNTKNVTMCPACDFQCDYFLLSDHCVHVKVAHLVNNNFAIVYSTLMALWASVLSGFWKRRNRVLQRKWNLLLNTMDEKSRPQYIAHLVSYRNRTGKNVKKIPTSLRFAAFTISGSIILFFIILVVIATISIMGYEIWITAMMHYVAKYKKIDWILSYSSFIITFSSSVLDLITITVLNNVYGKVATYLNDWELYRTRSEYDRALTVKIFAFQFINTYASILYIALIKGKFIGFPGNYNTILGFRQPECTYGDCLMELNIQLAVIMIGREIIQSFLTVVTTFLRVWLKRLSSKEESKQDYELSQRASISTSGRQYQTMKTSTFPWEEDYQLLDYENERGTFNEYLELAIQYGFVVLFAPAFPLAPLFAWIKNIFEIRFDARKILKFYRRLVPYLNPNMKIWLDIFNFIGHIAVLINAIVIAFSSNVITHFIYSWYENGRNEGFLNATLSEFNISDYDPSTVPESSLNVTSCYYTDFRMPYWSEDKYEPTWLYWYSLVAKFVFIIFYQNVILLLKNLILKSIPEIPGRLHQFQKEERDFILSSLEPKDSSGQQSPDENSRGVQEQNNLDLPKVNTFVENSSFSLKEPNDKKVQKQLEEITLTGIDRLQSLPKKNE